MRASGPAKRPGRTCCAWPRARRAPAPKRAHADLTILAADTAVVDGKAILGKPKDMAEAVEMLKDLRGHSHQVYTGIAVLRLSDGPGHRPVHHGCADAGLPRR